MTKPKRSHPAAYPKYVLDRIALHVSAEARHLDRPVKILDPFAGVGRIHDLPRRVADTTGVELEPEWAACRAGTIVGDATQLPSEWTDSFDALITSPTYGNRLADKHEAKDACAACGGIGVEINEHGCGDAPMFCSQCGRVDCTCGQLATDMRTHNRWCPQCRKGICPNCNGAGVSKRYTYRHSLGRMPTDGSSAVLQWGCLAPGHRVLRGDWRWVPVETLQVGDPLIGFDEYIPDGSRAMRMRGRRWRSASVEAIEIGTRDCVEIEFADRGRIRCTVDHPWLVDRFSATPRRQWRNSSDLIPGDQLPVFFNVWQDDESYDAGWLAGVFDGEGSLTSKGTLTISQKEGLVFNRALDELERRGCDYRVSYEDHANTIAVRGDLPTRAELLGKIRPVRLLPKLRADGIYMRAIGARVVTSVRRVGPEPVVLMGTTTRTYVAEGMASHNSAYRALHEKAWLEAHRVVRRFGLVIINCKNHIRNNGQEQTVVEWHAEVLRRDGFYIEKIEDLPSPGLPSGNNQDIRVDFERLIIGRRL